MNPLIFEERWKYITDKSVQYIIPNRYLISDSGKIFNQLTNKYLVGFIDKYGYHKVQLPLTTGESKKFLIHRIVAIEFIPNENYKNLQVNHFDGNKTNNNVWNLEWVTAKENTNHAIKNGLRNLFGENSPNSTITNEEAEKIGYLLSLDKYTQMEIADIVGCSRNIVSKILNGKSWRYVYTKYNLKNHTKKYNMKLTTDELHLIFKYFEDHKNIEYDSKADMLRNMVFELFGIRDLNWDMYHTLMRLYRRERHNDISDQYNF